MVRTASLARAYRRSLPSFRCRTSLAERRICSWWDTEEPVIPSRSASNPTLVSPCSRIRRMWTREAQHFEEVRQGLFQSVCH